MRFVYKVGLLSILCAFLLMSHNSYALDTTINLNDYEKIVPSITSYYDYSFSNSANNCSQAYACDFKSGQNLTAARTHQYYELKKGDIVTYQMFLYQETNQVSIGNLIVKQQTPGYNVSLVYFRDMTNQSYFYGDTSLVGVEHISKAYEIALTYAADGTYQLGSFNTNTVDMYMETVAQDPNNTTRLKIAVTGFTIYRYKGSNVNQEQSQATQDAANDSQQAASDNSSSSQTTNLIGAFQSFVTAITSLSATNCNVTLPFPSSLGGNMQVNICQNKDYAGNIISVFASLTLIVFYIPFSLRLLSMIYNEIRSFTNG